MPDYLPKLSRRERNLIYTADGSIWINYLLSGVPLDLYEPRTVAAAQRAHAKLFESLVKSVPSDDFFLGGFKAEVRASERMGKVVRGLPGFTVEEYPELNKTLRAHHAAILSGRVPEYTRVYWLSVQVPMKMSFFKRVSGMFFDQDPFEGVGGKELRDFDAKVRAAIPEEFAPQPTEPEHLDWVFDRARLRGHVAQPLPEASKSRTANPPARSFPQIIMDTAPDAAATVDQFASLYQDGEAKANAQKSMRDYFSTLREGRAISIRNPGMRTEQFPDGLVSYQSVYAVSGYNTRMDRAVRGFTSAVDLALGLDADFVVRFTPADDLSDTTELNKAMKNLDTESAANSESVLDAADYADRQQEIVRFRRAVSGEKGAVTMKVTTLFAFGHAHLPTLMARTTDAEKMFRDAGYRLFSPVGGQEELWRMMLPGSPTTSLGSDLYGATTAMRFGAYAPVRRGGVGDGVGIPLGQYIDNALGSEVYLDVLNATERGNASIAFTGAQGRGKSHAGKQIVSWMNDMGLSTYVLDGQGEWATFAQQFESHQVIDLVTPDVSVDPLKLADRATASRMLQQLLLPMFNVRPDSKEGNLLIQMLTPEYLEARGLDTTRKFLEHVVHTGRSNMAEVIPAIRTMLRDPMMAAFVDPEYGGNVRVLPPARLEARNVVFYTKGLPLPQEGKRQDDMTVPERYTLMANTAVALLTAWRFDQLRTTSCFVLDEASFYDGLDVLTPLIKTPDRTGRKHGTFVLVLSQTGEELDKPEYKLIRRRICMGQDREANAAEALKWGGFIASRGLVHDLVAETSPLDPSRNNLPIKGREGEGYFNDGTSKGKVRVYPVFREDRKRLSDTSTGNFIRYGEQ